MRIFNAAQPFAAAAGVTMAPWCTDLGTVSGVVSFKAPIITPAQYNSLVDQFRRTNMAQAMAAALNLDPCTTSVSIVSTLHNTYTHTHTGRCTDLSTG